MRKKHENRKEKKAKDQPSCLYHETMFQASNGSTEVPIAYKSFVACQRTKERESETQSFSRNLG